MASFPDENLANCVPKEFFSMPLFTRDLYVRNPERMTGMPKYFLLACRWKENTIKAKGSRVFFLINGEETFQCVVQILHGNIQDVTLLESSKYYTTLSPIHIRYIYLYLYTVQYAFTVQGSSRVLWVVWTKVLHSNRKSFVVRSCGGFFL